MAIELFDCTLRDGGSVTGGGASLDTTVTVTRGLIANGVKNIEVGITYGMGSSHTLCAPGTPTDDDYIAATKPFTNQARLGMFLQPKFGGRPEIDKLRENGFAFSRIGANVGGVEVAEKTIREARDAGIETRFSLMKAWATTAEALAEDARKVAGYGAQVIHIMDSTGSFMPDEVERYCTAVQAAVPVPVGFHGHNNLGLSVANAMAANRVGIDVLDCSLCGFARSAGNAPTEMLAVVFQRLGKDTGVDVFGILDFIEKTGAAALGAENFVPAIDVVFGLAGFHSSFMKFAKAAAERHGVSLHRLIWEVCQRDKINPSEALFEETAKKLA
ncbi:MAG: 4-hydroxy-2-oxovalerate aldolase [Planctomycetes bacterium]|nr:4-hydroxy-2-oxovalerate aldolase [Planctomycetota bacterium]